VVSDIDDATQGRTLHGIFNGTTATFLEALVGSRVVQGFKNGKDCNTWPNFGEAVCNPSLVVLQDPSSCNDTLFTVGVANDRFNLKGNCDGWPQNPGLNFPRAFRFWSR